MKKFSALAALILAGLFQAHIASADCPSLGEARVKTHHQATIGGKVVEYDAVVGYTEITAPDQHTKGCIFFTTYVASGQNSATRPIIFAFNGGPGSASLWLHLGMIGPRRVDMGPEGLTPSVPAKLVDNPDSLLDVADLVLIDPMSTGFSGTAAPSSDPFFGVKNDYKSVAEFIRSYLNEFARWPSPKYVMGESYGGVRSALLAHYLQSNFQMGISLNGVIMISPALTMTTLNFNDPDNDLPYVLFLPSMAATAAYHGRSTARYRGMTAEQVFSAAQEFAEGDYFDALLKGDSIGAQEYSDVARKVSELLGLEQKDVENLNLRVADSDFFGLLLKDQNLLVGRLDARFTGGRLPTETGATADDPSMTVSLGAYTSAINQYLREELGVRTTQPYLTFGNITSWSYDADGQEFGVMPDLNRALIENTQLRLYVASGYYDLACPMGTVLYDMRHLAPRQNLSDRVQVSRFETGHMVYIRPDALARLKAELRSFIR